MGAGSMCVVWVHTDTWDCGYGRGLIYVYWHSQVVKIKLHSVLQTNPKQWMKPVTAPLLPNLLLDQRKQQRGNRKG